LRIEAVITHAELTTSLITDKPLDLAGSIDLAAELGAGLVTFHMGGPVNGLPDDKLWSKTVKVLKKAANHGSSKHVALAVDGIWPTWIVDSPDALSRLFKAVDVPEFGVNFDPCYLTVMGVDPLAFIDRFAKF